MATKLASVRAWVTARGWWAFGIGAALFVFGIVAAKAGWSVWLAVFAGLAVALILIVYPWDAWADVRRRALFPVGWALIIVLPLTLPLIVVLIAGSPAWSLGVQLVLIPLAVVAGWRGIVLPSVAEATASWKRYFQKDKLDTEGVARRIGLLIGVLVALVVLGFVVAPKVSPYEDRPGASTDFFTAAVLLWLLAIGARVLGYGISWATTPLSIFGLLGVAWGAVWTGILPGWEDWLKDEEWVGTAILVGLGASLAFAILLEGIAVRSGGLREWLAAHPFKDVRGLWPRGIGDAAAMTAGILLAIAAVVSYFETREAADDTLTKGDPAKDKIKFDPTLKENRALVAETFAPRLIFTKDEGWRPIPVEDFLEDASLTGKYVTPDDHEEFDAAQAAVESGGDPGLLSKALPDACPPLVNAPCSDLTIRCELPGECTDRSEDGEYPPGAAYVRVVRKRQNPRGRLDAFAIPGRVEGDTREKILEQTRVLVQYWFFYRFNEWNRPTLTGRLAGRHEGDWEAVTVGLSETKPLFVALSAHCNGAWFHWKDVEVADTRAGTRTHPLVAVAEGSHAHYVETQDRRSPDWAGCAGIGEGAATLVSYASNIRDKTEDGGSWRPTGDELKLVTHETPPMSYKGGWGATTRTLLINRREHELEDKSGGPNTPPLQRLWREPIATIFCSNWVPNKCKND